MRIIAGAFKGRKLAAIRGMAIRPTADRVREALFSILAATPVDAVVLDLFAGTGALGIEALSRGARQAVFVDQATAAIQVLRKNIALCRVETCTQVLQWDILRNLNCLKAHPGPFDLIFIDPPYGRRMIQPTLAHIADNRLASPDALVVVEHDPSETVTPPSEHFACVDQRHYGQTQLSFFAFQG
ncbi:MAG: 16S rRNA (guanine(966)-N(2))-methyltransferase RsmD [Desulfatitalea sp.]